MSKTLTPLKAIRAKCLDCSSMSKNEVRLCEFKGCPLYHFRFGRNPNRKGIGGNTSNARNTKRKLIQQAIAENKLYI
ncbi:MAG: hypothetical protein ACOWWR_18420 [Eubacteriales bacterium]